MQARTPRIAALRTPPLAFAHRGARKEAQENTLPAFSKARSLGAQGLESDVWLTADGHPVLDHDGVVRRRPLRARPISQYQRDELPDHIPTLAELYETCGHDFDLSLDLKDPAAAEAVIACVDEVSRRNWVSLRSRLWLCVEDLEALEPMCQTWPDVGWCYTTKLDRMSNGPERCAAALAEAGVDAVNLRARDWTGGLTTLFHRFGVLCFAWDAQFERVLDDLLNMGVDAVYSDYVDRMLAAMRRWYPDNS